jgi:DNA gyrase/topoisomerase IV subunit A
MNNIRIDQVTFLRNKLDLEIMKLTKHIKKIKLEIDNHETILADNKKQLKDWEDELTKLNDLKL